MIERRGDPRLVLELAHEVVLLARVRKDALERAGRAGARVDRAEHLGRRALVEARLQCVRAESGAFPHSTSAQSERRAAGHALLIVSHDAAPAELRRG